MDYQEAFNIALGGAAFLGGLVVNKIWAAIERLDNDSRLLPRQYVSKEDYKSDIHDIKVMLRQISDKLEGKVDK